MTHRLYRAANCALSLALLMAITEPQPPIEPEDIQKHWGQYAYDYFADLLNGDCTLEETKADLLSLINSEKP